MRIAPDSNTLIGLPPGPSGSTIAGMRLFGLILRKSGLNCSPWLILTGWTEYGSPISSSATEILRPLGVFQVQSSIGIVRPLDWWPPELLAYPEAASLVEPVAPLVAVFPAIEDRAVRRHLVGLEPEEDAGREPDRRHPAVKARAAVGVDPPDDKRRDVEHQHRRTPHRQPAPEQRKPEHPGAEETPPAPAFLLDPDLARDGVAQRNAHAPGRSGGDLTIRQYWTAGVSPAPYRRCGRDARGPAAPEILLSGGSR